MKTQRRSVTQYFLFTLFGGLLATSSVVQASGICIAADTALALYTSEKTVDPSRPSPRLFGYSAERHDGYARPRIYNVENRGTLSEFPYGCQFETSHKADCWKQTEFNPRLFAAPPTLTSLEALKAAAAAVERLVAAEGVNVETIELMKVWPSTDGIHVHFGFEARVIEVGYVCRTASAGLSCHAETQPTVDEPLAGAKSAF